MFTITINAKTPEEFKQAVKGLYALFPDSKEIQGANAIPNGQTKTAKPSETKPVEAKPVGITVEDVRKAVQEKTTTNEAHKEAVKAILSSFGAPSVTKLDPASYSDFLTKIQALA